MKWIDGKLIQASWSKLFEELKNDIEILVGQVILEVIDQNNILNI